MYGLFCNTYDYYEWHDLVCVSASEGDLIEHHKNLENAYPLLEGEEQASAESVERPHFVIEEVEVV